MVAEAFNEEIRAAISLKAMEHHLEEPLIAALVMQESSGNPKATRYEDKYKWTYFPEKFAYELRIPLCIETTNQKTSFGLMQCMGAVARENGCTGPLEGLLEPLVGLEYGCLLLKQLFSRIGYTQSDVISAYNQGGRSKTSGGMYLNQKYVDSVWRYYRERLT